MKRLKEYQDQWRSLPLWSSLLERMGLNVIPIAPEQMRVMFPGWQPPEEEAG
jgi:hypothetical protein